MPTRQARFEPNSWPALDECARVSSRRRAAYPMRGLRQLFRSASALAGTPAAPFVLAAARRVPDLAPRRPRPRPRPRIPRVRVTLRPRRSAPHGRERRVRTAERGRLHPARGCPRGRLPYRHGPGVRGRRPRARARSRWYTRTARPSFPNSSRDARLDSRRCFESPEQKMRADGKDPTAPANGRGVSQARRATTDGWTDRRRARMFRR